MKHLRTVLGVLVTALLVWILARGTDWSAVAAAMGGASPGWLIAALLLCLGSCFARVQRWSYIVRAARPATFRSMFSATQIGMLANLVIPARIGEVIRAVVLASLARIPFAQSMTLVAVDRVTDVIALVGVLFVAVLAFPTATDIEFAAGAFGNTEPLVVSSALIGPAATSLSVALGVLLVLLVLVSFRQAAVLGVLERVAGLLSAKLAHRVRTIFLHFAEGLTIVRSAPDAAKAVFFSLLTWLAMALSLAAVLVGFRLDFPWFAPFLMLAMLAVCTSVTVTPGLIGQYHIAVVASLLMIDPHTDPSEAKAIAIVAHLVAILPVAALGIHAMLRERMSIGALSRQARAGREPATPG